MVELREARRIAAHTGLGLQYVLKEARVFDIWTRLSPLYSYSGINHQVVVICKGGTVLNKVFFSGVQRFSEDLDHDAFFMTLTERSAKIRYLDRVIRPLLTTYSLDKPRMMREVLRFTCSFTNELGRPDSIFIEFNLEPRGPRGRKIVEAESELLQVQPVKIQTYTFQLLIAKKLKTLYERESGKDLYDLYRSLPLIKDWSAVKRNLKEVLRAEGIDYSEFRERIYQKLHNEENIKRLHPSTNPYIPRNLRPDWIKAAKEINGALKHNL